ncbi:MULTISPECIES: hypothetical protein [unclassified Paludibacterium]|uniref:hypothetical protein n=1 Tax=unclassified Paludibacterium TaxID=2618429 RepID=UPI001C05898E|nr:hypothetical protein [Paludibacterium sp. B53371]BEV70740.1 fimbrial protein [Paludibacterium sp. THUN1379]
MHCKSVVLRASLLALALSPAVRAGQISLYPMEVKATAGTAHLPTLTVINSPDSKTYVSTRVTEILKPNTPQEKEVELSGLDDKDLIASPSKFVLAPGANKKVRLVFMDTVEKERDFRVYTTPVTDSKQLADLAGALEGTASAARGESKAIKTEVSVAIAWGALIRLLPAEPKIAWSASVHDGKFYLKNTGNVRFHVKNVQHCDEKASCPAISKEGKSDEFNVYPDMERLIGSARGVDKLTFDVSDNEGGPVTHILAASLLPH